MTVPTVLAVLVPNGLGHARRTVGVLGRYLARGGSARVVIAGEAWQEQAARRWPEGRLLAERGARWHHGVVAPGVSWGTDPSMWADGRLLRWEERLADLERTTRPDVVLSDNLVGVLSVRSDALLLGSFLWSDVLAGVAPLLGGCRAGADDPVGRFIAHERRLLAEHRPEMLCVEGLAMPGVLTRTRAVPVGWLCPGARPSAPADEREGIVVLGGGTGAADDLLVAAATAIAGAGFTVRAAGSLAERAGVGAFDPWVHGWDDAAAVVCRAGAGTVTDAIDWSTPIVCVDEGTNVELRHNASRVESLGFGVDAGAAAPPETVVAAVRTVLEPARAAAIRERMAQADKEGLDQAAEWLALHCGVLLGPRPAPEEGVAPP